MISTSSESDSITEQYFSTESFTARSSLCALTPPCATKRKCTHVNGDGSRPCVRLGVDLEIRERLLLLAQDVHHVHRGAGGDRTEQELHGTHAAPLAADLGRAIDDELAARARDRPKSCGPDALEF